MIRVSVLWLLAVGGCVPEYAIVRQANPNPYLAVGCKLGIREVDYTGMKVFVPPGTVWLGTTLSPEQLVAPDEERKALAKHFTEELVRRSGANVTPKTSVFTLWPKIVDWDQGDDDEEGPRDAKVNMTVAIVDLQNVVQDEVTLEGRIFGSLGRDSKERMTMVGEQLAKQLSSYLAVRLSCP